MWISQLTLESPESDLFVISRLYMFSWSGNDLVFLPQFFSVFPALKTNVVRKPLPATK